MSGYRRQRHGLAALMALLLACGLAGTVTRAAEAPLAVETGLFGSLEFPSHDLGAFPQWRHILAGLPAFRMAVNACARDETNCSNFSVARWVARKMLLEGQPNSRQLAGVNQFVNSLATAPDAPLAKPDGRWAGPKETLREGGDPLDLAVLKYVLLRELGFADHQLRIVIVTDTLRDRPHAVLIVRTRGTWVLDSRSDHLQKAADMRFYLPHISLNGETRWAHMAPWLALRDGAGTAAEPEHRGGMPQ
ncbi:transglutaminase-like cysteine peptidase [Oceanibacterium hippocampi]|uniref:Transglutaminase-like domain-containing protein n=1 Tax=Oceanibacterium hippocampi TaxID=745714 RepID=A0A1Y5RYY4_9PROT|nr:transglutaminase-like cysteine peptidase [Oceanibacterium hippocampi]SLN28188.1 hypothetical protein OCH7691_00937 [Oceanibacterium hippocampi]